MAQKSKKTPSISGALQVHILFVLRSQKQPNFIAVNSDAIFYCPRSLIPPKNYCKLNCCNIIFWWGLLFRIWIKKIWTWVNRIKCIQLRDQPDDGEERSSGRDVLQVSRSARGIGTGLRFHHGDHQIWDLGAGGRQIAVRALGMLGDERSVEALVQCLLTHHLSTYDDHTRRFAMQALRRIGSRHAIELLRKVLNGPEGLTRLRAQEALASLEDYE